MSEEKNKLDFDISKMTEEELLKKVISKEQVLVIVNTKIRYF